MTREIIISQEGHEAEIAAYLSRISSRQGMILDMGGTLPSRIRNRYLNLGQEESLPLDVALKIDRIACRIAQTWYGGDAGPTYHGISVGDMLAYEVMQWLISAIKHAVIMERICREFSPEVVVVEDNRPVARIMTSIAGSHGLSVRRLASAEIGRVSRGWSRGSVRRGFINTLKTTYEWLHAGQNSANALAAVFAPGFRQAKGLRCVLFDPYVGYEWLIPQLFGSSCAHIVMPCPNLRLMPRIRYYQRIFGISTSYFHLPDVRVERGEVRELQASLATRLDNLRLPDDLSDLDAAVWAQLCSALREHCESLIQSACTDIGSAERMIRKYRIDAIVLPYDEFGIYKALALVGRRKNLLTIAYQHGVMNKYPALIPPTSGQVVVWDKDAHECLRSWGVTDHRIAILPNPMLPLLKEKARRIDKKTMRRKFGFEDDRPIVLFAAQPFTGLSSLDDRSQVAKTISQILAAARRIPEFSFLIKVHSYDVKRGGLKRIQSLVDEEGGPHVQILTSGDSHELVIASDVVISGTSTCLWEAVMLDRPAVAFVDRAFLRQVFPYQANSGVIRTDSVEELVEILRDVVGKEGASIAGISRTATDAAPETNSMPLEYFGEPRWDLFSLIPAKAKTLLDVGCGVGWLGKKVKSTRPCRVVGIEKNADAGKMASKVLDAVFVQDIEKIPFPFRERAFDCIVVGDLLEHLCDPWGTLRGLVGLLHDNGVVIMSIPNIGHYTTLFSLAKGHWEYKNAGILDRTHLRFFTRCGIEDLLEQAGLRAIKMLRNTQAGSKMRTVNLLTGNRLAEAITFQYLIVADRHSKGSNP